MQGLQTIDTHAQKAIKEIEHYLTEEKIEHKLPKTRKLRFDNQLEVIYLLNPGKEKCNFVDHFQPLKDKNLTTLPFTVNLMTCGIGLDMSRKELFYKSYWTHQMPSNEVWKLYQ